MEFSPRLSSRDDPDREEAKGGEGERTNTTDRALYERGILNSPNTKGTSADHAMQPRCFQFVLFRAFVHWYYLPHHTYGEYVERTRQFYQQRIARFTDLVQQHQQDPGHSPLARYL